MQHNSSAHVQVAEAAGPAIISTLGFVLALTSPKQAAERVALPCVTTPFQWLLSDSNNDSEAHVTILLFGLNHSGTGACPSHHYAHQYTLTIDFIQLQMQFSELVPHICQLTFPSFFACGEGRNFIEPKYMLPCEIWVFS